MRKEWLLGLGLVLLVGLLYAAFGRSAQGAYCLGLIKDVREIGTDELAQPVAPRLGTPRHGGRPSGAFPGGTSTLGSDSGLSTPGAMRTGSAEEDPLDEAAEEGSDPADDEGSSGPASSDSGEPLPDDDEAGTPIEERVFSVDLDIVSGELRGQSFTVAHTEAANPMFRLAIHQGDTVLVWVGREDDGRLIVGIDEFHRSRRLLALIIAVMVLIVVIAGEPGVRALLALTLTMVTIFVAMAGLLIRGVPPVLLGVGTALVITAVNLLFIAGRNRKALIAAVGTAGGTLCAGLFAWGSLGLLRLTGFADHESQYLPMLAATLDVRGILVCGVLIGTVGAVMDVAVAIASALQEVGRANSSYTRAQLFAAGMNIGRDTIGSMTNTLVLAYTGSSLTMILVFALQREDFPLLKIMNMEFIATELLRSIAGLLGMALAIPLTAFIAARLYENRAD
jgi:uncharacterized membrane protein